MGRGRKGLAGVREGGEERTEWTGPTEIGPEVRAACFCPCTL